MRSGANRAAGCAVAAAALLGANGAGANDSSAELAAGGLRLERNAAIEMRAEDLYISAAQVRVHYRFFNTARHDVAVTVAFPMPDITVEGLDDLIAVPTQDPQNLLGFSTIVDGAPVAAQVEQKAFKGRTEVTAYLRSLGVPLAPHLASTDAALDRLPAAVRAELVRRHLAMIDEYDAGKGWERHWDATWTLKTTYFWRQVFPAHREVIVEHRYAPSVGESAGTEWGSAWFPKDPGYGAQRRRFCVDDAFLAAVGRAKRPGAETAPFTEQRVDYVLSTGANWAAPIADFRMVVDKGDPANIVSFCGEGVRKISPTQFEVRHTGFTPRDDVSILILRPAPKEDQ